MVDFIYKRLICKINERAFCSGNEVNRNVDVVYIHSNDEKSLISNSFFQISEKQYTLFHLLEKTEEELFAKIKKNCRYEIKRAQKEECIIKIYESSDLKKENFIINDFKIIYDNMFKIKGLKNRFNKNLISSGINSNQILITLCENCIDPNCKVYHAYLIDNKNAVLLYSASSLWKEKDKNKINLIGRMNKYLHWNDILWFKEKKYLKYEWGGITNPFTPNGIDKFKMEFGGEVALYYNYIISKTLLGKIYCFLVKIKNRRICKD